MEQHRNGVDWRIVKMKIVEIDKCWYCSYYTRAKGAAYCKKDYDYKKDEWVYKKISPMGYFDGTIPEWCKLKDCE
jgi:hypothetical protein